MNKLSLLFMCIAMVMCTTMHAQRNKKEKSEVVTSNIQEISEGKLFGTVISYTKGKNQIVEIEFGDNVSKIDKSNSKMYTSIIQYKFSSLIDALFVLSSHGWYPEISWNYDNADLGLVTSVVISKEMKIEPMYPWKGITDKKKMPEKIRKEKTRYSKI